MLPDMRALREVSEKSEIEKNQINKNQARQYTQAGRVVHPRTLFVWPRPIGTQTDSGPTMLRVIALILPLLTG
ncbi:MAG TPA: alpha/beta hydrolase, partial [Pseudomonas sp.]